MTVELLLEETEIAGAARSRRRSLTSALLAGRAAPTSVDERGRAFLLLPATPSALAVVRDALVQLLLDAGWPAEERWRVITATGEALINAVEHGSRRDDLVGVEVAAGERELTVRVLNAGRSDGAAPPAVPASPPPVDSPRGRGLLAMAGLAERISIQPLDGGAEVVLEFALGSGSGGDLPAASPRPGSDAAVEESPTDRIERLQLATAALSGALRPEEVAAVTVSQGLAALDATAGCLVLRLRDQGEVLAAAGDDAPQHRGRFPLRPDRELDEAILAGRPTWGVGGAARSPVGDENGDPYLYGALPLVVRGRVIGGVEFRFPAHARLTRDERTFALTLAQQSAQALDRALLYQEQHRIARTLQDSLLPAALPQIPGIDAAARYLPADGNQVGGDLYDLFASEGAWSLVIGDVCGKGAEAAALTALVRYTVRAAAMHEWRTREVLMRLNEAVMRQGGDTSFCSVVYGRLQPVPWGVRATLVSAGHPPPLLVRASGELEVLQLPGMLLGIVSNPDLGELPIELLVGDCLILYTDGVTEAGGPRRLFGEERLHALARRCAGLSAEEVAEAIVSAAVDFQRGVLRDDIAVLVLRACPEAS